MAWMNGLTSITERFSRLLPRNRRWRISMTVGEADEVPAVLPHNNAVLVGTTKTKWIVFDCPCRTGHRIMLNVDDAKKPYWRFNVSANGRLTIYPSIFYRSHLGQCHFFIQSGKTLWTKGNSIESIKFQEERH